MRDSATEQLECFSRRDFGMGMLRPLNSRSIWLALDDNHEDSRRVCSTEPIGLERVTPGELTLYQRQLFYWLMIRNGPCFFSRDAALEQGLPTGLRVRN